MRPSSASHNNSRLPYQDSDKINNSIQKNQRPLSNQTNLPKARPSQQVQLNKPSNMEWEKLYEESLQMKALVNQLRDENTKLRTKNVGLDRDLHKCGKIIEEVEQTGIMKRYYAKPSTDNNMILQLKSQVKQLREELDMREQEIHQIKRSSKYTKLTEMEIEKKLYQDETLRLKQFIEDLIQQNVYAKQQEQDQYKMEELIQQRDNLILQMQQDLEQYEQENKNLQDKFQQLVTAYQDIDREYNKLDQESKQKCKSKDKQIIQLKNDLGRLQMQQQKQQHQQTHQQPAQQVHLKKPIGSNRAQISPNKVMDKSLQQQQINSHKQPSKRIQSAKPIDQIDKAIQLGDIEHIIQEIKYRLISEEMESKRIDSYLFNDKSNQSSIQQIQDKLMVRPFQLDRDCALKFARYLIESPQQQYPYKLNVQLLQDNGLIRSIFFRTIGYWACYDQVEQKVIEISLLKLFDGLLQRVDKLMSKNIYDRNTFIKQINDILAEQNRTIRELELNYIISRVIKQSLSLNKLKGAMFSGLLREIAETVDKEEDISLGELQKYYEATGGDQRSFFFYKQQRTKQEQMLALLGHDVDKQESEREQPEQKSKQQYLIKSGLMRSHSDPDPLQMQQLDEQQDDSEYNEQYQQYQQQGDYEYDDEDDNNIGLNNAKIDDYEDEYNNAEGVFDEDDEDDNDQWEKVENKANYPIRQEQIPNSRPTSSYVNKVNKSLSDAKATLKSDAQLNNQVNEVSEQYEEGEYANDFEDADDY